VFLSIEVTETLSPLQYANPVSIKMLI